MRNIFKKAGILLIIFVAALLVFAKVTNHETKDLTQDMPSAALPVVYLEQDGMLVNELHGYTEEMDASTMRDAIAPVGADHKLPIFVKTYGTKILRVSYEIRSLDGTRLVEENSKAALQQKEDEFTTELQVADLLEQGQEYLMILKLHCKDETVFYYTRLTLEGDRHTAQCLDFAMDFHDMTLNPAKADQLSKYLEPSSDADDTTLQKVTIENRLHQVTWGDLQVKEAAEPVASIKEMNDSYSVIVISSILAAENGDGQTDYFQCEEYYRVRMGNARMYLLNYERTVNEVFGGDASAIAQNTIDLGIRSEDVDFWSNETGNIVCFVQNGELWGYNQDTAQLTKIFSFRSGENMDVREGYDQHDIRIIKATESGSVDFIVYGYMNCGDHEGQVGISVCHYDSITNSVEEWLFLPSTVSYQVMKEKISRLMYTSDAGVFYLTVGDAVHAIDVETKEDRVLVDDLKEGAYQVSADGRYLAWCVESGLESQKLSVMDLNSETVGQIEAEAGSYILPLGFLDGDCIYGVRRQSDQRNGQSFPMYSVRIAEMSENGYEVVKSYEREGIYVRSIGVEEGTITLNLMKLKDGGYVGAGTDTITNREMEESQAVRLGTVVDRVKQKQMQLLLAETDEQKRAAVRTSKLIVPESSNVVKLDPQVFTSTYYVYAKGRVLLAADSMAQAVDAADQNMGVVVDGSQNYVWERARKERRTPAEPQKTVGSTDTARALNIMLEAGGQTAEAEQLLKDGQTPLEILEKNMQGYRILNVSGCSLEQVLYYAGRGSYVYCESRELGTVLLTGYDEHSVWVYDVSAEETQKWSLDDAAADFKEAGNIFYTYLK